MFKWSILLKNVVKIQTRLLIYIKKCRAYARINKYKLIRAKKIKTLARNDFHFTLNYYQAYDDHIKLAKIKSFLKIILKWLMIIENLF